ncbi:MAG: hypothetical protein L6V93_20180 [Clostridiales bacterium]|nr:MAG: hypothetical protein L6V93_20180 [Clostridiales bacterium]
MQICKMNFSENSNSQNFEPAKLTENAQIPSEASKSANSGEIPEEKAQNQTNKNASLIAASWGEVINRSIKRRRADGVFCAKRHLRAGRQRHFNDKSPGRGKKRATILTNKEK